MRKEIECAVKEIEGLEDVGAYLFSRIPRNGDFQDWIGVRAFVKSKNRTCTKEMQIGEWYSAHATMLAFVKYFREEAGCGEFEPLVKYIRRCLLALKDVVDFTIAIESNTHCQRNTLRVSVLVEGGRVFCRDVVLADSGWVQVPADYHKNIGRSVVREFFEVIVMEGGDV